MWSIALLGARLVVGGVYLYASLGKLPDLRRFAEDVANYRILPAELVPLFAVCMVGLEAVSGALLVAGVRSRAAALVASLSLSAFIVALVQALLRGINLDCGCFGGAEIATWNTVARDVALLLPALVVVRRGSGRYALRPD